MIENNEIYAILLKALGQRAQAMVSLIITAVLAGWAAYKAELMPALVALGFAVTVFLPSLRWGNKD